MAGQAARMVTFMDEYGTLSHVLAQLDRRGINHAVEKKKLSILRRTLSF
jgi:hypothetical protein